MKTPTVVFGTFNGAFSSYARNWYYDLTAFGFEPAKAHQIACDAMSDLGNAMRSGNADVSAKISKAKKDGTSEFKFGGKSDRAYLTSAMSVIRIAQTLTALKAEKLLVNCVVFPSLEFSSNISHYVGNLCNRPEPIVEPETTSEEVEA